MRNPKLYSVLAAAVVATTAISLAPAGGSSPSASPDNRCFHAAENSRLITQTRFGLLFSKPAGKKAPSARIIYGCLTGVERSRRLRGQDPLGPPESYIGSRTALEGRYAAYSVETEGAVQIHVHDLIRNELKLRTPALEHGPTGENARVTSIVAKRNGSVAWIVRRAGGAAEVRKVEDRTDEGNVLLDSAVAIDDGSLAMAEDRKSIYWTGGGEPRRSEFR